MHLLVILILILILLSPAALFAQAGSETGAPLLTPAPDLATGLIQSLAARFPWITSLLAIIGTFRLLAKPACMWLERRAQETPDMEDDLFLARARRSTAVKVLDFFLDLGFSVKRDVVVRRAKKSAAPMARVFLVVAGLAFGVSSFSGCSALGEKWSSLSPNQQAALKAVAKTAVLFGLNQLGDSVKELRPYQPALLGVINATFSATDNAPSLGTALKAGIETVIADQALRDQVLGAIRAQLGGAPAATAATPDPRPQTPDPQQRFNASLAAQL